MRQGNGTDYNFNFWGIRMIQCYVIDTVTMKSEHVDNYDTINAAYLDMLECSRESNWLSNMMVFVDDSNGRTMGSMTCLRSVENVDEWAEFIVVDSVHQHTLHYRTRYVLVHGDVSEIIPDGMHYSHTEIEQCVGGEWM